MIRVIKKKLIKILIIAGIVVMKFMYFFMKIRKIQPEKVLFISRQNNHMPLDFKLVQNELIKDKKDIVIKNIFFRYRDKRDGVFYFIREITRSMWHMSNSKVVVLDAYWPAVSVLKHKNELIVFQLWHSIGKIKKTGYQSIGNKSGRNPVMASLLRMHKNYDYVIAGGIFWNKFYCQAFNISESKILNYGLPRLDLLVNESRHKEIIDDFYKKAPELRDKRVILYVPTYRTYDVGKEILEFMDVLEKENSSKDNQIILRFHPNQYIDDSDYKKLKKHVEPFANMSLESLLLVADDVITDYSSIAIEAVALKKKLFFYVFDIDKYKIENGLNIEPKDLLKEYTFSSAKAVSDAINNEYDVYAIERIGKLILPKELGKSTKNISRSIIENLEQ